MNALAIVPCRLGSKGVPLKNIRPVNGISPVVRAVRVAKAAGCRVIVTSEADVREQIEWGCNADGYHKRPAELATDEAVMIDVVKDALASIPGPPEQIILLVQCTQPLRDPKHLTQAIALLIGTEADSVVSVVAIPLDQSPDMLGKIDGGRLVSWEHRQRWSATRPVASWVPVGWPTRRQDARPAVKRDGTCYGFSRRTVSTFGNIYGHDCRPLIVPASESCPLDTEDDWREAERRLRERDGV